MNDVDLRTKIIETLYDLRTCAGAGIGAIEVAKLSHQVGESAKRVALVCGSLAVHGHIDADGNLMGNVRLSDKGMAYYEEVTRLNADANV